MMMSRDKVHWIKYSWQKSIDSILLLLLLFCTLSCMHLFLINSHQCSGMARCLLRFTAPPEAADRILTISSRVRSRSSNNRHYKQCRFCFVLGLCCCCFLCRNPKSNWPRYWKCNHDRREPLHSYHNSTYPNWRTATRQWVFAFLLHSLSRCMAWQNGRRVVFCVRQMSHLMRHWGMKKGNESLPSLSGQTRRHHPTTHTHSILSYIVCWTLLKTEDDKWTVPWWKQI